MSNGTSSQRSWIPSARKREPGAASRSGATTRAPSSSSRSASHAPTNPCAPVTSTGMPAQRPLESSVLGIARE
jgi:hypothetical protein